jgi:multiple sugar transport system permease protein
MLASLYLSFTDYDLFTAPRWVGLDNYVQLFTQDTHFLNSVTATLKYVLLSVPLQLVAVLAVAMVLNRASRLQGLYRSAFYAPSLLGASVALALVWRAMFTDEGAVDQVLRTFGIESPGWGWHSGSWFSPPSPSIPGSLRVKTYQSRNPVRRR